MSYFSLITRLSSKLNPTVRVAFGAAAISFSGIWVNIADVTATSSAFYRVCFGFLFLLLYGAASKNFQRITLNHGYLGFICGFFFVLDLVCWHQSILRIGPGLSTLLSNFQVFFLAAAGITLFKERYSRNIYASIPLAVIGLFFLIGFDWIEMTDKYKEGIFLGLATAFFYACYLLFLRRFTVQTTTNYLPMLAVSFFSTIILGINMVIRNQTFVIPDTTSFFSLVSLGFFSQFLGWLLIATSLPKLPLSTTGLLLLLQPSLAFIWDVLLFDRTTTMTNWLGLFLSLIGIYFGITAKSTKP